MGAAAIDWHSKAVLIDPHYNGVHVNGPAILDTRSAKYVKIAGNEFECDTGIPLAHVTYSDKYPPMGYPIIEVLGDGEFVDCTFNNVFVWTALRNKPPGGRIRGRLWMHRHGNRFRHGARWSVIK